jgi:protein-S-isoprenylcysteine O-methyltransferase Ste14
MSSPSVLNRSNSAADRSTANKLAVAVLDRRVPITIFVFIALLVVDFISRVDPRNLANLSDYHVLFGLGLVLSGLALRTWAAGTLHKRTQLATTGPYAVVRHPLYIGSFLMMLGFGALIDDRRNIWFVLAPILVLYIFRALQEERIISAAFPGQWPAYAERVPRFLPRRLPGQMFAVWDLRQWLNNREYQAVGSVLLGLCAVQFWHLML